MSKSSEGKCAAGGGGCPEKRKSGSTEKMENQKRMDRWGVAFAYLSKSVKRQYSAARKTRIKVKVFRLLYGLWDRAWWRLGCQSEEYEMRTGTFVRAVMLLGAAITSAGTSMAGQANDAPVAQEQKAPQEPKAEMSSRDTVPTFKVRVNLVQVKAVVRDSKGQVVKDLEREDFLLYDQGKLQAIGTFGKETPETLRKRAQEAAKTQEDDASAAGVKAEIPQRFVAVVIDDVHLEIPNVLAVRSSTAKLIEHLGPTDRMGIFSTSGQMTVEFTSDKEALKKALKEVTPRPPVGRLNTAGTCPDVTYYMGDLAINQGDSEVIKAVREEVLECQFKHNPQMAGAAD
jgi:hypothetical protein